MSSITHSLSYPRVQPRSRWRLPDLSHFWRRTRGSRPSTEVSEPVVPVSIPPELRCPGYSLLQELTDTRQFIEVTLGSDQQRYQSMVLALDPERDIIWLDDLFPLEHPPASGDRLQIRHRRRDREVTFETVMVIPGSHCGAEGLAVLLPRRVLSSPTSPNRKLN